MQLTLGSITLKSQEWVRYMVSLILLNEKLLVCLSEIPSLVVWALSVRDTLVKVSIKSAEEVWLNVLTSHALMLQGDFKTLIFFISINKRVELLHISRHTVIEEQCLSQTLKSAAECPEGLYSKWKPDGEQWWCYLGKTEWTRGSVNHKVH